MRVAQCAVMPYGRGVYARVRARSRSLHNTLTTIWEQSSGKHGTRALKARLTRFKMSWYAKRAANHPSGVERTSAPVLSVTCPVHASRPSQIRIIGTCVAGPAAAMSACCLCDCPQCATTASPPRGHSKMWLGVQPWRAASAMCPHSCTRTISTPSGPVATKISKKPRPPAPRHSAENAEIRGTTSSNTWSRIGTRWPRNLSAPQGTVYGMSWRVAEPKIAGPLFAVAPAVGGICGVATWMIRGCWAAPAGGGGGGGVPLAVPGPNDGRFTYFMAVPALDDAPVERRRCGPGRTGCEVVQVERAEV